MASRSGSTPILSPLALICLALLPGSPAPGATFIRGDSNRDGELNIADPQFTLGFLFLGGRAPDCLAAADANDDEALDISDALATLGFLFLGDPPLPPPGPLPGSDPTPGLRCGLEPPQAFTCKARGPAVDLAWSVTEVYEAIEILRDDQLAASLDGESTSFTDHPPAGGSHTFGVRGKRGRGETEVAVCRVSNLPSNLPPGLVILSPAQGTVIDAATVQVTGRVSDDNAVVRIVAAGVDVTPAGPPAVPYNFTATIPLGPGPNLLRIEAVDDFGRTAFKELAVGRNPILQNNASSQSVALDISGGTGYGELEGILQPFLNQVPALLSNAIAGATLVDTTVAGIPIRLTGDRVEVTGAIVLDLFPSAENGGRLGLSASFERIKIFAKGRSDFGFLGTDNWDAELEANSVVIRTLLALSATGGGSGVHLASDGFVVDIGSSSVVIRGFLDPLGIFDAVANLLAGLFNQQIEGEIKTAVQKAANDNILPILEGAFSSLRLNLDLGTLQLGTRFHDVLESANGLSVLLDAAWSGAQHDPAFPPYPGSAARLAPYPTFPLGTQTSHPVDVTISLSADTLNQALYELTASGLLKTTLDLSTLQAPLPLEVGTIAAILDERLLSLPGVKPDQPLGLRVEAAFPASIRLASGAFGRSIVGEGSIWRVLRGTAEPPPAWAQPGFDDSAWERAPAGFGYSSDSSELRGVRTELDDMANSYTSLYTRVAFQVGNPAALTGLTLYAKYDDGFVAYLNGTEVARVNVAGAVGARPPFNATAEAAVEPTELEINLASRRSLLRSGDNVLAIQAHNASASSSDFVLVPALLEPVSPPAGSFSQVPAVVDLENLVLGFVADTKADGVGETDMDGVADEVELFALKLKLSLQSRLVLVRNAGEAPELAFQLLTEDGPDGDKFPDAIVGGMEGIEFGVARESIDLRTADLLDFGNLLLSLFGPTLGDALKDFDLPSFPIPELAFDLDSNGSPDVRLDVLNATFAPVDTTGDRQADWICILANLAAVNQ